MFDNWRDCWAECAAVAWASFLFGAGVVLILSAVLRVHQSEGRPEVFVEVPAGMAERIREQQARDVVEGVHSRRPLVD